MAAFFGDVIRFVFGFTRFSGPIWALSSIGLALLSMAIAALGRQVLDPVAVIVALKPARGLRWMPLSVVLAIVVILALAITIVGSPLAVLALGGYLIAALVGYAAVAVILGDRILRSLGQDLPAWWAALAGVILLRIVRAVPYAGGVVHGVVVWFGFACAMAVTWDKLRSWYRRRMPDDKQFAGADVIEWNEPDAG